MVKQAKKYKEINTNIRKKMRKAKEEWTANNSRVAFDKLETLTSSKQTRGHRSKPLTGSDMLERWSEYCTDCTDARNYKLNLDASLLQEERRSEKAGVVDWDV